MIGADIPRGISLPIALYDYAPYIGIFRNEGGGSFRKIQAPLRTVWNPFTSWGDFDRDGALDLFLSGKADSWMGTPYSAVYRFDKDQGQFRLFAELPALCSGSAGWGDYDGDGDLDLVVRVTNSETYVPFSRIYRNEGGGRFREVKAGLPGIRRGNLAWGDADNDDDLDLVLAGATANGQSGFIYFNRGTRFELSEDDLPLRLGRSPEWADADRDGDLDLLMNGIDQTRSNLYQTFIYRNTLLRPASPSCWKPRRPTGK